MHSRDASTITNLPSSQSAALEHGHDLSACAGRGGWEKGSGSVLCMRATCDLDSLHSTVHEVRSSPAVHVNVDEARRDVTTLSINDEQIARRSLPRFPNEVDLAVMALYFGLCQ